MDFEPDSVPQLHIITITVDEEDNSPQIDLADVPPAAAICLFEQAAEALRDMLVPPTITFKNEVIYNPIYFDED
jgi:hypothetical protein